MQYDLEARVCDTVNLARKSGAPRFLGFLTMDEAAEADALLKRQGISYSFFGGYTGAERTVLCCADCACSPVFPIDAFTISFRKCDKPSHRDFLGALMALGITRESVGDILIGEGRAVIFVRHDVSRYVSEQLDSVGRIGVKVSTGFCEPLPQLSKKEECSTTVASARLDCIVSAVTSCSRTAALDLIANGDVSINSAGCKKASVSVASGDRVTIRRKGKFEIVSVDDRSKKGRIILKYNRFI